MNRIIALILIFFFTTIKADPLKPLTIDFFEEENKQTNHNKKISKNKIGDKKKYEDLIKDKTAVLGFWNFYIDEKNNSVYLSIKPEQLNSEFLMGFTRQGGDGYQFDGSSMLGEGVFFLKRVGEIIQLIEKNTKFRADESRAISRSIESHIPNSIIASSKIISAPNKENNAILINVNKFFIYDFANVSRRTNNKYSFDKENSYYNYIKSFPLNSEVDVYLHFKSNKGQHKFTLASSKSMMHRYHVSISALPDSDYTSRIEDDRVGYFTTMHQDYSNTLQQDPYVRYINRWNLKKADPHKKYSEPIEPIVFWLENTIPIEFRSAVERGILAWNKAFERIGYLNAIVVKQMPDDADWDPADVRYNTIRWMVHPQSAYAVGPSRANPYTGELYDADIRVSNDYIRFYFDDFKDFITPIISEDIEHLWKDDDLNHSDDIHICSYGEYLKHKMAFTWNYLITNKIIVDSETTMMKFVEDGIVDLLLHEVGHTLGLRHNFKASSVFSYDQLSDPNFTNEFGVTGSVMDYNATNLLDGGINYFQTIPGPYDYWAIEYGYSDKPFTAQFSDEEWLESIAERSLDPWLSYATDEDAYSSTRSIDPLTSTRDMTSDPIRFYDNQIKIANDYWNNLLENFEKDGETYSKLRSVFFQGLYEYYGASRNVPKFIGGIYHSRHHIGQDENLLPLTIVDNTDQRRALNFLLENILAIDAFSFEPEFLNKMAPERYDDFTDRTWNMQRLDFPIHNIIKMLQRSTLSKIHNPRIIHRVHDNVLKINNNNPLTIFEIFDTVSDYMWSELKRFNEINSFRRDTQSFYVDLLINIYFNENEYFPRDTQSIAYSTLRKIKFKISDALPYYMFDNQTTSAHLRAMINKIDSVLDAKIVLK